MNNGPAAPLRRLAGQLADVRQAKVESVDALFRILGPSLAAARRVERELDRVPPAASIRSTTCAPTSSGCRVSSRTCSSIPTRRTGRDFCSCGNFLKRIREWLPSKSVPALDPGSVATQCERWIDSYGRLDISIEIGTADRRPLCIAIENKPYSPDGEGQVDGYLQFLRCRYAERFLLIYLSPHGGLPATDSLPRDACRDGLRTLPYCTRVQSLTDADMSLTLPFTLTDWLRDCELSCNVDRLRWFLRDTANFCHKTFGGVMTTDREHRVVRDFILESEDNLLATLAVRDAYPKTRNEVIAGFLECLRKRVACDLKPEGLESRCYFADNPTNDGVWVYRDSWVGDVATPYVWLGHDGRGDASRWWLGLGFFPYGKRDRDARIESLSKPFASSLGPPTGRSENFPWYRYLPEEYRDWAPLLVRMHQERQEPSELIDHFATEFVRVTRAAVHLVDGSEAGK